MVSTICIVVMNALMSDVAHYYIFFIKYSEINLVLFTNILVHFIGMILGYRVLSKKFNAHDVMGCLGRERVLASLMGALITAKLTRLSDIEP